MINIYIKELDKIDYEKEGKSLIRKVKWKLINDFNIIQTKEIESGKKIYLIPNIYKKKIYRKLIKKLENEKTKTEKLQLILSNKIKEFEDYFSNYKIVNGRRTFVNLLEKILKKILKDNLLELQDIYILTNSYNAENINTIRNIASKVKTINIITNKIDKFRILERMLESQEITISNNKRKSLKKAKIIINLDFKKEEIKQYIINRNAIIISLTGEKLTSLKGFNGNIIRDIELKLEDRYKEFVQKNNLINFKNLEIYESLINLNEKNTLPEISKLIGNNGEVNFM